MEKLNILIVEKSLFYRDILARSVEGTGLGSVTHFASSDMSAFEKLRHYKFDAVIFDPGCDGPDNAVIDSFIKEYPAVFLILMLSDKSAAGRLPLGKTLDYIVKPDLKSEKCVEILKKQLQGILTMVITGKYTFGGIAGNHTKEGTNKKAYPAVKEVSPKMPPSIDIVVIASSTGGPSALDNVLKRIPAGFEKPILIVQHMPGDLTRRMAQSLDKKCALDVLEAEDGMQVKSGMVLIAPGGFHMAVRPGGAGKMEIALEVSPPVNGVKPSADVLLFSIAKNFKAKGVLALILTGMGSDGMNGVREVKQHCRCYCIAQSERTCVVYGMPKSIVEAGLSDRIEDLESIPLLLAQIVSGRGLVYDI